MKPVTQTLFAPESGDEGVSGNCWAACLASILELDLAEVPNFCAYEDWWQRTIQWLNSRGLHISWVAYEPGLLTAIHPVDYFIMTGKSPRGDFNHSVVGGSRNGTPPTMIHDPHPSLAGIVGVPAELAFIYKL